MRDNMIICISGLGPGHCMAIDMNIEHLIGYLKVRLRFSGCSSQFTFRWQGLLQAKGMSSTWDRLGNISAAIISIQRVKKKVSAALDAPFRSSSHTTPDTSEMIWRVQRKTADEDLHQFQPGRSHNSRRKFATDILMTGEAKLKSSTLGTFNKKIAAMIEGHAFEEEEDECPMIAFAPPELPNDC